MSGQPIFALVAGFSALLGMSAAGLASDTPVTHAPMMPAEALKAAPVPSAPSAAQDAPASILVEVRHSSLHRISQFTADTETFSVPVYFVADAVTPSEEALLLLGAVADEASTYAGVAITIRAKGLDGDVDAGVDAARAMAVFNSLNELGVPTRMMALDLDPDGDLGPGASLSGFTSAI
ncbi:MAG: hypothetical protein JJ939_10300 [Alphaproteobacteria bacterium]|nr:hypothetical protein [Alphaproteobacteria bacterium]MBO6628804.1 hypothetical protein [Alphaproteobacteria bacterium]MDF1627314.1 hypothetical protein [Parvibaculaceae bacterium]